MYQMEELAGTIRYTVPRETDYYVYTAFVVSDYKRTIITLYTGKPNRFFSNLFTEFNTPVLPPVRVNAGTDVGAVINRMIAKFELPLYQKELVLAEDEYIDIDYEAELERLRKRDNKPNNKEEYNNVEPAVPDNVIEFTDWQHPNESYVRTSRGNWVHKNSFDNLKNQNVDMG